MSLTPTRPDAPTSVAPQFSVMPPNVAQQTQGDDYADQILAMTREEVFARGMPKKTMERCISDLFECLFEGTEPKFLDPSAYAVTTTNYCPNATTDCCLSIYENYRRLILCLRELTLPHFWHSTGAKQDHQRHQDDMYTCEELINAACILLQLLEIPQKYPIALLVPTKRILLKCMDCLIHKVALDKNMHDQPYFSLYSPKRNSNYLLCVHTEEGWRCASYDTRAKHPIHVVKCNTIDTQKILLDENHKMINEPGIIITAELVSELLSSNLSPEEQASVNGHVVLAKFLFYNGTSGAFGQRRNSTTLTVIIDLRTTPPLYLNIKDASILKPGMQDFLTEQEKELYSQQLQNLCLIFKDRLARRLEKPIMIPLFDPQSQLDKLQTVSKILLELKKNPEQYLEEIFWVAEQLNPTFSSEEVDQLVQKGRATKKADGTIEITPKALVKKLRNDMRIKQRPLIAAAMTKKTPPAVTHSETTQHPILPLPKEETKIPPASQQQSVPDQTDVECVHAQLEKQAHQAIMRQQYEFDFIKQKKKAEASGLEEKKPPQAFKLTSRDQAVVDSIYNGKSVKVDDFVPVAMNLLKKKAESLGATTTTKRKGSHLKFHLKKAAGRGSTGMTFVLQHRKRDHQGSLSAQKDALERIFSLE